MSISRLKLAALIFISSLSLNSVFAAKGEPVTEEAVNLGNSSTTPIAGVTWIFPTNASTSALNSVDTLIAQWQSNYTEPNLGLWCKAQDGLKFTSRSNSNVAQTGSRAVILDIMQIAQTVICHLTLQDLNNPSSTSDSAPFTIAKASNATPQTWSAKSPTAPSNTIASSELSAPTITSSPSILPAGLSNSPSASGVDSSSSLSTAAGVGIGVGAAVLVTLLAVGALLLYLHLRQRRKSSQQKDGDFPRNQSSNRFAGKSKANMMMMKKKTIRVIPGVYETIGNRPVPQELDASVPTLSRTQLERSGTASSESVLHDSRGDRSESETANRSSSFGSVNREIGELEGVGCFI